MLWATSICLNFRMSCGKLVESERPLSPKAAVSIVAVRPCSCLQCTDAVISSVTFPAGVSETRVTVMAQFTYAGRSSALIRLFVEGCLAVSHLSEDLSIR